MDLERLELGDFEHLLGESFVFSIEGVEQTASGELIQAKTINSDSGSDRQPFCLDFKFPADANLGQSIYFAAHEQLPEKVPLFLVPYLNTEGEGWFMTAHFN